ncbi:hypothetical protein BLA29_009426, partial [Euroglyphus maynei]
MNSDKIEISLDQEKDFHPELVLFGDVHVKIPVPEAKVFNNLDEYYKCSFQKKIQIEGKNQPKKPANLYERNVAFFQKQSDNDNETTRRRTRELTD